MRTLVILLLILCWFVGDIYTSAGIYRYIRHRQGIGIRDKQGADAVVVDGQFLNPLPVDFLSLIDLNVIDQLVYHSGYQLLRPCVLSHSGKKHICRDGFTAELVQLFAERLDLFGKRGLFFLIALGHFGKAFIRQLAGKIIFVDSLKQTIQFTVTGLCYGQLFLFQLPLQLNGFLGATHNCLLEFILITHSVLGEPFDLTQNHLFQKIHTDVMGRCTSPPAAVVVGAVKVFDIVISLIEMEVQFMTAIRTNQQAAEHITFAVLRLSPANLATLFLNLFPDHTINNRLMHVFENRPVFPVIGNPLLVLIRLGIGLEVQYIPAILLQ